MSKEVKNNMGKLNGLKKLYIILIMLIVLIVPSITIAEERSALKDSYFGNFNNCKIQKKSGNIKLEVWNPWIQYSHKINIANMFSGIQKLNIAYDEIWISEYDELFTETEKKKWKGMFDLNTLYWKNGKVQAYTLEKFHIADLLTGQKLFPAAHKIIDIYNRSLILEKLYQ